MSIYRKNAKPEEPPIPAWERIVSFLTLLFDVMKSPVLTGLSWILALAFIAAAICLIAALAQWVVTGFAGHPVGNFYHYIGAVVLYILLNARPSHKDESSKLRV